MTIYAISTKDTGGDKTDADQSAAGTGGAQRRRGAFSRRIPTALHQSFDKLRDIIRSRYLVAYKPADFEAEWKIPHRSA